MYSTMASPCMKAAHHATCSGSQEDKVQGHCQPKLSWEADNCASGGMAGIETVEGGRAALQPAPDCHMVGVKVFTGTFSLGSG